jgi:hypothetical protein
VKHLAKAVSKLTPEDLKELTQFAKFLENKTKSGKRS